MKNYSVYVLIKDSKPVYVGCTMDVKRRIKQHKSTKDFDSYKVVKNYNNSKDAFQCENAILRFSTIFYPNNLKNCEDKNILNRTLYNYQKV